MSLLSLFRKKTPKEEIVRESTYQQIEEERLLKEYQICLEQASRLESNIWQTAGLLGIGSIVGLISLIGDGTLAPFGAVLVAAVFAINVSLVWLRFTRRWGSIQTLKFERMSEIERKIDFKQSVLVEDRNKEALSHKIFLRESGNFFQYWLIKIFYRIPSFNNEDVQRRIQSYKEREDETRWRIEDYEYRGIQPVCKLLVITNILLWSFFAGYAAYITPNNYEIPNTVIALLALLVLIFIDIIYWRFS